jgi:DNA repair exonuclease SbcCD ATPase subunit
MKQILFKAIKIKNFLSVGDDELYLDFNSGINLITGENLDKGGRNGVGKSSLIESIYWCLFGNTIRDIKKDNITNSINKKTCKVSLNFFVEENNTKKQYLIMRSLDPSKLLIEEVKDDNTKEDISLSTIPKTEEYIKNLIGANEEVFQNAVIMTANNTIPFMAQKKVDKRKFIEGIFNLDFFSQMLLKVRSDLNEKKKENELLAKDFVSEQKILNILSENKESFDDNKKERIENIEKKIKTTQNDLDVLKNKNIPDVSSLKSLIKDNEKNISKLKDTLSDTNKEITALENSKSDAYDAIRQAKKEKQKILDKGNTCPTCNREYCEEDLDHITNEIKKLDDIINKFQPIYDENNQKSEEKTKFSQKITSAIEKIKEENENYREEISNASLHEQKIKSILEKIEEYRENIEEIKKEFFKDDNKIDDSKNKIQNLEEDIKNIQKDLLILENAKFIVSEEGVKTFIVKKLISLFNNQLNFYLKTLDAPCTCEFNELFEETIFNSSGKECSYFNFSGGERKRIDIAILFTFQDILKLQTGISFNIAIYDEWMDSSLDQKGVLKFMEILRNKVVKNNECVYLISHNTHAINSDIDNTIFLEKKNGITSLKTVDI